jgi:ABC-type multidrug transport system fused ATPase/permease subunit
MVALITMVSMITLLVIGFIVEAWPRGNTKVQQTSDVPAYDKANLFSQITFHFYQPIISLSAKRPLTMKDIENIMPESVLVSNCYPRLEYFWMDAVKKAKSKNRNLNTESNPSLFKAIMRTQLIHFPAMIAIRMCRVFAQYAVPALLSLLLLYFQDTQNKSKETKMDSTTTIPYYKTSLSYGLFLVVAMFLAAILNSIFTAVSRQYLVFKGLEIRTALISMVYRKALRLSPGARQKETTGSITNHMSVDADIWGDSFLFLTMWISVPSEIIIGILQCQ